MTTKCGWKKLALHAPVGQYRHNGYEDNTDAHLKRQIMGREMVSAITEDVLDFGMWEQIFYGEFEGRRRKRLLVKVIGELEMGLNKTESACSSPYEAH